MAWQPLSGRLGGLPLVLAGPMLRKVAPESVTVWVVTKAAAQVTLRVLDASDQEVMRGARATVAIGTNLHIAAVTATAQAQLLREGAVYQYDLDFSGSTLATATKNAELSYASFTRPTFALPPADLSKLRILHGSCRLPHGEGIDALPIVDQLIKAEAANPLTRPHQLLMTGDQIYADDVSASMLHMLSDASDALLGWQEALPGQNAPNNVGSKLRYFSREAVLDQAGFTSTDLAGHLMSLGEYICMYLCVWSDVLWDAPTPASPTLPALPGSPMLDVLLDAAEADGKKHFAEKKARDRFAAHVARMATFQAALSKVRRALANIPSYTMFDDHEVTDDWNMTFRATKKMLESPIGARVFQNGLIAYALCQHWGNRPEEFASGAPGARILDLLNGKGAADYTQNADALRTLAGLPDVASLQANKAVVHPPGSLTYNYTVEGPGHQVIVTDSRTWRAFPHGDRPSELLPKDQIDKQVASIAPSTNGRALLVVVSTNAPPIQPIRTASRIDWLVNRFKRAPDVYEAWELPWSVRWLVDNASRGAAATERLYRALSERLPLDPAGARRGVALLLSGDVHFAFASRLLFKATSRFEDPVGSPQAVSAVIAQLVSSGFRKEDADTRKLHKRGYWGPYRFRALVPSPRTEGYAGWNLPTGTLVKVGEADAGPIKWNLRAGRPASVALSTSSAEVRYAKAPDYFYRLDYLGGRSTTLPQPPGPIPAVQGGADAARRKQAASSYSAAASALREYLKGGSPDCKIVGNNNISEIVFDPANKRINHLVRWWHPETTTNVIPTIVSTIYQISVDPDDPAFSINDILPSPVTP